MSQARGAMMQLLLQRETTFRTLPAVPATVSLPFTKWNVGRDPQKQDDPSISNSPLPGKSGFGDAVVKGSADSILDLRTVGYWLMLLLGVPTAYKAVTKQPTHVTGVTIHYADTATTAGAGTLTFVAAAKTLTWKAQGDATAGAPIDVSAGGQFTLASGTASHGLTITVDVVTLPATDQADADISVSATLKTHRFPVNLNLRSSAIAELGHLDINKFYQTLGLKLNKISYDIGALDQSITLDLIAGEENEQVAAFDAAPLKLDSVRACGAGGFVGNGSDNAIGVITSGSISIDNGMTGKTVVSDGKEGYGLIDQGDLKIGGSIEAVFDGAGAYSLARAGTSTRLRISSTAPTSLGTFSLNYDIPNVEFIEKPLEKAGKSGLFAKLDWKAHRDAAGHLPVITLTNDVPSYQ